MVFFNFSPLGVRLERSRPVAGSVFIRPLCRTTEYTLGIRSLARRRNRVRLFRSKTRWDSVEKCLKYL